MGYDNTGGLMKKHFFGVTAGIILWLAGWAGGQTPDPVSLLNQARSLVEQKQYAAALEVYAKIESWLGRDPGLVIETARVQTYADRHAEAIRLFEAVRKQHPEKQYEFLADLGDQYCWNGQAKEAEPVFREALKHNPQDLRSRLGLGRALRWSDQPRAAAAEYDLVLAVQPANIEALNGKADALSRIDRLEEAIRLFRQVTAIDPHNVEALNGIARCRVWQGYHRQGRDLYLAVLKEFPGNPDALEGLAFAQHWDGRDDQANQTLSGLIATHPERPSGQQLHREIEYSQEPVVTQENRYREDKYGNSTQQHGLRAGFHPDKVTTLDAIYDWRRFRDRDHPDMNVNRAGIGGGHKFSDLVELNSFWYANDYDYANFTPLTADNWLTLRPNDLWRFDFAYNRETYEGQQAALEHIVMDSGSVSADFLPNRYLLFSGKGKYSDYSDGNEQKSFLGKAELRVWQKPYVKLYYNYYFSTWAEEYDHGYFNPDRYQSHTLGLYSGFNITERLFFESQASYGHEWQVPSVNNPTCFAAAGFRYRIFENWQLLGRGEFFEASPDPDHNSGGYRDKMIFIGISHNFGEPSGEVSGEQVLQRRSRR